MDDRDADGEPTFSRDCPEDVIRLPDGKAIVVMPNHFQSRRGGDAPARRALQISPDVLPFDTVRSKADEASSHHLLWADHAL